MRLLERGEVVLRHVDDDLGLALVRERDDRLARGHDLADLEAQGRDNTAARRAQRGVLQLVACEFELPRLRLGGGLGGLCIALRVLFVGFADRPVELQPLESLTVRLGLLRLGEGRGQLLLRGLHCESVVNVVEHSEHVAFAHDSAHVHATLDDLAADTERLLDFVTGLHGADVAMRHARFAVSDFDGADGPQHFGGGLVAARGQRRDERCNDGHQGDRRLHDSSSGSAQGVHGSDVFAATGSKACHPPPSDL